MLAVVMSLCFAASIGFSTGAGCFGNVMNVPTTGASRRTASQDKLKFSGVKASEHMAAYDLKNMNKYKLKIESVARKLCMDAAVIAGIISRESRAGAVLRNGWGDNGNAFGLMQIDKRWHKPRGTWNSGENIMQGTEICISMIKQIKKKFPSWSMTEQLKGGIAAYNAGPGNIKSFHEVDARTTGQDYSNDVIARAKYFKAKGY
ncbi:lysozyme g-like isoform X2 [Rhinatrema bivittatum]|nr:lysozyme g-like isoform X2 [Rhinatrema bivittatum]